MSSYYEKFLATGEVKCIDDEIPFDIPQGWEWCRLGYIFSHCTGKALNGTNRKGNLYTYITTSNLYWDRFELSSLKEMYFTEEELGKCTATKGDLLVCEGGDIGRSAIWDYDYNIRIQNHIHKLRSYIPLCTRFFYYVMYLYKGIGYIGGKGIGIQGLSSVALHNILIPTPSINEQERIVSQIEAIMPIAVKYEKSQEELNQLNDSIHNKLRKSILQEAIQGKLVPQIEEEGTAQELLEQIRQEKFQLVKEGKLKKSALSDSVIYKGDDNKYFEKNGNTEMDITDEIPFEIPDNWEWCRIGSVLNIWSARRVHEKDWRTSGIPFYRAREIGKMADCGYVDNDLFIEQSLYEEFSKSGVPQIGDLMMTAVGTLGKTYVVETKNPFYYKDGSVLCIGNPFHFSPYYLKLFFESSAFTNQYLSESDGTTVATLTMVRLNRYLIPIPPLMEQARIVEMIKQLASIMRG